jgi:sugar phosphate isomerase/epimerase
MLPKLAIADFTFPKLQWDQALRLASDLGFGAVDVGLFAGRSHLRPEELFSDLPGSAARVSAAINSHQLEIADVFGQAALTAEETAINQPDASQRKNAAEFFRRILDFTARCKARHLTILPGVHFEQESYEDSLSRSAEELSWRVDEASKMGIVVGVEPHIGSIVSTPPLARQLVEVVPGLTLTLDYTHFTLQGIPDEEVEPLLAFASHFHARGACIGKLQASMKENTIDYARILRAMKTTGYEGYVVLEYVWTEWMHCNEVDNLSETVLLRDLLLAADAVD